MTLLSDHKDKALGGGGLKGVKESWKEKRKGMIKCLGKGGIQK
jgi:hypothetical protein